MGSDYEKLKLGLKIKLKIDLNAYKERQMRRRINQWLTRHQLESYQDLLVKIDLDGEHRLAFSKYLTINTSQFFRDSSVFKTIEETVLPAIGKSNRPRIWSAGCSIGVEIYSVAMLLQEQKITPSLLLATDLDRIVLDKARKGIFLPNQIEDVDPYYLKKYFTLVEKNNMAINKEIKRMVLFKHHDLLKDRYERNFDLILCRNVFIYLTSETQKRLINKFVESLKLNGFFIVGSAEQIMDPSNYGLQRVHYCVYRKSA